MSETLPPRGEPPVVPRPSDPPHPQIDWSAIAREPEFQELVHRRRSFVLPATAFFLSWYMGFIVLTAVAPDFMGERIYQGLTVGYTLALTQFVMVLVLGIWYMRKSDREFDPLAARVVERYGAGEAPAPPAAETQARHGGTGRLRRDPRTPTTREPRP
jgi:uncharacterized membrane protein (DUF485 family)